jgi:hypothetical protein
MQIYLVVYIILGSRAEVAYRCKLPVEVTCPDSSLCEKVLGPKHPPTLGYMDNLTAVIELQGKCEAVPVGARII